jgi:tetratricopeptide (TPR) repeat protein
VSVRFRPTLVAALVIAGSPVARGATPAAEREARRDFAAAEGYFKAGQFASALAEYQAGYAASPLPGFLINIAQCQRRLGDLPKARATYQKFLIVAPDSPLVPEVKSLIAELDKLIADLGEGETATEDASESPPPKPDLAAPPPALEDAPDAPAAAAIVAVPAQPPATPPSSHRRWWLWGAIGAAVVGGTVAAFALSSAPSTTIHDGSLGTLRK